jgi:hypothetical protein
MTVGQLYGLPHGIVGGFNNILYENEFQNPQIFIQTISLFPEQSTLVNYAVLGSNFFATSAKKKAKGKPCTQFCSCHN